MPLPQALIARLLTNREKLIRYAFIPQLLVALLFLGFAYHTGRVHAQLLLRGAQTQGRIVSFRSVRMSSHSSSGSRLSGTDTVQLPLIEFPANDHLVRFEEWKTSNSDPIVGSFVPVLYDPADASIAMMDRALFNWLPWAPCAAIGLLLALAALKGLLVSLFSSQRAPSAAKPAETS